MQAEQTRSWRVLEPWEYEVEMSNRKVISRHLFSGKHRGLPAQFDQENNDGFGRFFTWPFQIRRLRSKNAWIGRLADRGLHRLEQTSRAFSHWECLILGPCLVVDFPDGGKSTLKTWALDGGTSSLLARQWTQFAPTQSMKLLLIPPLVRWSESQEMAQVTESIITQRALSHLKLCRALAGSRFVNDLHTKALWLLAFSNSLARIGRLADRGLSKPVEHFHTENVLLPLGCREFFRWWEEWTEDMGFAWCFCLSKITDRNPWSHHPFCWFSFWTDSTLRLWKTPRSGQESHFLYQVQSLVVTSCIRTKQSHDPRYTDCTRNESANTSQWIPLPRSRHGIAAVCANLRTRDQNECEQMILKHWSVEKVHVALHVALGLDKHLSHLLTQ